MGWDRESNEEYDDGYTRESFERADEDTGDEERECLFCGKVSTSICEGFVADYCYAGV